MKSMQNRQIRLLRSPHRLFGIFANSRPAALSDFRGAIKQQRGIGNCCSTRRGLASGSREGLLLKEFKEFALKGNVVDLAIGVIIGAAFGKIVDSMVGDIIMPIISGIIGTVDFSNLYLVLRGSVPAGAGLADAKKVGTVLGWGNFLTLIINFIIIAWALFMVVKGMNRMKKSEAAAPAAPAEPPAQEKLLGEIRDLLAKR
jgi:large conductance mechanosensitive channel